MTQRAQTKAPATEGPDRDKQQEVVEFIQKLDITSDSAWSKLEELSKATKLDAMDVVPEDVKISGDSFRGTANVSVTLVYGDKREWHSMSDTFPAKFEGKFNRDGKPEIDWIDVDTSSFYE